MYKVVYGDCNTVYDPRFIGKMSNEKFVCRSSKPIFELIYTDDCGLTQTNSAETNFIFLHW